MFLPIVTSLSTMATIRNPVQAHELWSCGRSNGASPCRAQRTSTEPFCVCENNPRILLNFFFREKFLTLQYFHIFEFSSSSCLFGFGRFRCALVFFNTDFVCVTKRERVYVSICVLWRKGNVETVCVWYRHREVWMCKRSCMSET